MKMICRFMTVLGLLGSAGALTAGEMVVDSVTVNGDANFYGNVRMQQFGVEDIPTNGMIIYYDFDNNNGATVLDRSGKANDATVSGALFSTAGRRGGCYYFGGSTDQLIIKPGALSSMGSGTVSLWVRVLAPHECYQFLSLCTASPSPGVLFQLRTGGYYALTPGAAMGNWTTADWDLFAAPNLPFMPVDQWSQIVLTWNTSSAQLYMNGRLICKATDPQNRFMIPATTASFIIGRDSRGNYTSQSMYGYMDDFRVYNTVLSSQQVFQAYTSAQSSGKFEINGAGLVVSNSVYQIAANATNSFTGRVGIGTNAPKEALVVNGKIQVEDNIKLNTHWLSGDGENEGIFVDSSGKVGVGSATPSEKFHVSGGAGRFDQGIKYVAPLGDISMGPYQNGQ